MPIAGTEAGATQENWPPVPDAGSLAIASTEAGATQENWPPVPDAGSLPIAGTEAGAPGGKVAAHIVSAAASVTIPAKKCPRRRFSFSPCWLLS